VVETIGIFCDGSVIVGVFQHREYSVCCLISNLFQNIVFSFSKKKDMQVNNMSVRR